MQMEAHGLHGVLDVSSNVGGGNFLVFFKNLLAILQDSFISVGVDGELAAHLQCRAAQTGIAAVIIEDQVQPVGTGTPAGDVRDGEQFFAFFRFCESS